MDVASPLQSQDKFREKSFFNQVQSSEANCVKGFEIECKIMPIVDFNQTKNCNKSNIDTAENGFSKNPNQAGNVEKEKESYQRKDKDQSEDSKISSLPLSNKENENPEEALIDVNIHTESTEELKKVRSIEEFENSIEKDKEMVLTELESEVDQKDTEELEKKIDVEKVSFQEKSDSTSPHEKSSAEGFTDKPQSKDGPIPKPSPEIHNEICLEAVDDNESDVEMEEEDEDDVRPPSKAITKELKFNQEETTQKVSVDEKLENTTIDCNESDFRILLNTSRSKKRTAETVDVDAVSKKSKVDRKLASGHSQVPNGKVKNLKKIVKKLSREKLEEFSLEQVTSVFNHEAKIAELKSRDDKCKVDIAFWQQQTESLNKQIKDLSSVIRRYLIESRSNTGRSKTVRRITRSVGLQVMPGQELQEQAKPQPKRPTLPEDSRPMIVKHSDGASHPKLKVAVQTINPGVKINEPNINKHQLAIIKAKVNLSPKIASAPQPEIVDLSDDESPAPSAHVAVASKIDRPLPAVSATRNFGHLETVVTVRNTVAEPRHTIPPLPNSPNPHLQKLPPRPILKITKGAEGVRLSWNMTLNLKDQGLISSYQIYAYQEMSNQKSNRSLWQLVGDVKALALPMACTLNQFTKNHKYHFSVRAVDIYNRHGVFSSPQSIAY